MCVHAACKSSLRILAWLHHLLQLLKIACTHRDMVIHTVTKHCFAEDMWLRAWLISNAESIAGEAYHSQKNAALGEVQAPLQSAVMPTDEKMTEEETELLDFFTEGADQMGPHTATVSADPRPSAQCSQLQPE